jgi:hypothetical protein
MNGDTVVLRDAEHHGAAVPRGLEATDLETPGRGRYGRMFPFLPVRDPGEAAIVALAGAMAGDLVGSDNPGIPAGYTYLGQFIDHDVTYEPTSQLGRRNDPSALVDFRTPRLDLDSLYGCGPTDQPYLYERRDPKNRGVKLLVGTNPNGANPDLPRSDQEVALIGDPRNDENLIVAQLHLLFIRFHNNVVEHVRAQRAELGVGDLFREARRIVRWYYQWIVLHDFLPRVVGPETVGRYREERLLYAWEREPFIPVEFSGAAYRFGHSMVRDSYRLNPHTKLGVPVFPLAGHSGALDHLGGFRRLPPELVIDWQFFFETGLAAHLQLSHTIDRNIAGSLFNLPEAVGSATSLPQLNLRRGRALGLPAGSDVARAIGENPLTVALDETLSHAVPKDSRDALLLAPPLWYFVLVEAEALSDGGKHLGPVGGRIVAEVLLGLLEGDPHSYLNQSPNWTPDTEDFSLTARLPAPRKDDSFTMPDLVEFAQLELPQG